MGRSGEEMERYGIGTTGEVVVRREESTVAWRDDAAVPASIAPPEVHPSGSEGRGAVGTQKRGDMEDRPTPREARACGCKVVQRDAGTGSP